MRKLIAGGMVALMLLGCGKQKEEAEAEVKKIDEACAAGQADKAREIMLAAAKSNELFKRAFDGATKGVSDTNKVNACGLVLSEIKLRLKHS